MRRLRREKRRFFLGCEGDSEVSYGARLSELVKEQRDDIHLNIVLLRPGGGEPCDLVQTACSKLAQEEKRASELSYESKWILLDSDLAGVDKKRDKIALQLASEQGIKFIWQRPCHEGFLLRHISEFKTHRPQSTALAVKKLQRECPDYKKAMTSVKLASFIGTASLLAPQASNLS